MLLLKSSGLTMNFLYLFALAVFPFCALSDIFAHKLSNGQTKLAGSSFGVLGIDATFDYVVSKPMFYSSHLPGLLTRI